MKRTVLLGLVVLATAALLAPAAVRAQGGVSTQLIFSGTPGGKLLSESDVPLSIRGQLAVSFHGDSASGCATYGVCGYSGTIVVRPRMGGLVTLTQRVHGRIRHELDLFLAPPERGYMTVANVQRSVAGEPSGMCADGQSSGITSTGAIARGSALTIRVLGPRGSVLSTRCAGPLDADVASAGPQATISDRVARRGRTTVDLTGSHAFAVHGFAGTVSSTLVLALGKPTPQNSGGGFPPGIKTRRVRTVFERLTLGRVTGTLGATVQGTADPVVCRLLDSCGLTGTLKLEPVPRDAYGEVIASGPATRPYGDFLAALGRGRGGDPRGIGVMVTVSWSAGSVSADIAQAGLCTDTAPSIGVFASLTSHRGLLRGTGGSGPWRTRCPGPEIGDQENVPLFAAAPTGALSRPTFTISLRARGTVDEDGYTASLHGDVSVVVRRGRLSQSVNVQPVG